MLKQGKFGVEWTVRPKDRESSGLVRIGIIIAVLALISLSWTLVKRVRNKLAAPVEVPLVVNRTAAPTSGAPVSPSFDATAVVKLESPAGLEKRPPKLRNLLMRLEEAEKRHDIEMAITTIETIRALPGSPAADLDNSLARRLGVLNLRRLFVLKSAQWVTTVVVKRGDTASRIASDYGSTLASLAKLNGGDVARLRIGQKLTVLNRPRFNLTVHRRMRTADLFLNGKFFKRYDLTKADGLKDGAFEWRECELRLSAADAAELKLLLPSTTSVLVSEI